MKILTLLLPANLLLPKSLHVGPLGVCPLSGDIPPPPFPEFNFTAVPKMFLLPSLGAGPLQKWDSARAGSLSE